MNLLDRRSDLLIAHIDGPCASVRQVQQRLPFHIDGRVVLPDHMHSLWTLPEGDENFARRWRDIKTAFSKSLPATEQRSIVMIRWGERGIWQCRYWQHTAANSPFASFRNCVARALYPSDWLGGGAEPTETGARA